MNILLINHYAGSPRHGMEYRPFYLAREWRRMGHQVRIVAASCSHLRSQAPAVAGDVTEESVEGVPYLWLRTPAYRGNGVRRACNMAAFVGQLYRHAGRLMREQQPNAIIASSTYPLDNLPARFMARRCGARLVYEVHDLWPLSPMTLGNMSPWNPFIQVMQWAENTAYRHADRVISMLPNAREHMIEHGMEAGKFAYVPNGIVVAEWNKENTSLPESHSAVLDNLRECGHFILGYAGGHTAGDALGFLLEAVRLLRGERFAFVLVGAGADKENLMGKAKTLGLQNVTFLPAVAKSAVPALLRGMDALYIGWLNKPLYRFGVSPNKIFDYMMAGRPVIHSTNASNDIVAESGCGFTVPPENPDAIVRALRQLAALSPEERKRMGDKGREYVVRHHDYSVLARRFLECLES
jgi:glycosyltransferase involved in cell wall biosynthesis